MDENKLSKNESNKNQLGEKEFDTDKYNKLIADRQFRKALSYLVELADSGTPGAALGVAAFYEVGGEGIKQDLAKAVNWYQRAINTEDDTEAKVALACLYRSSGPEKFHLALELFDAAAADGAMGADFALGVFYYSGRETGVVDLTKSKRHLEKAADAGHVAARIRLGILLARKEGAYIKGAKLWLSGVKEFIFKVKGNRESELIKIR